MTIIAVALHNAEEWLLGMTGWVAAHPWMPGRFLHGNQQQFGLALVIVTVAVLVIGVIAVSTRARWSAETLVCIELEAAYPRIDVLANNAGGIFGDRTKTIDGFEKTFQINHLAPFLLTTLLMDTLIASGATVIQTSSVGARLFGRVNLDDLDHDRDFSPQLAYGTAKLENILFTTELHRRYHAQGLAAVTFHPGLVATGFATKSDSIMKRFYSSRLGRSLMSSPDKGADQLAWLATTTPGSEWRLGGYYEKRKPARRNNPQALDRNLARELWDRSAELLDETTR